jgi:hypothetical protein
MQTMMVIAGCALVATLLVMPNGNAGEVSSSLPAAAVVLSLVTLVAVGMGVSSGNKTKHPRLARAVVLAFGLTIYAVSLLIFVRFFPF